MNLNRQFAHEVCAGIDKVSLWMPAGNFDVKDGHKAGLKLKAGTIDLATGETDSTLLFRDKAGRQFEGAGAYDNSELYNLNINRYGLNLIFNPSKPYHPHHLCTGDEVLQERTERVFNDLYRKGIKADWLQARLTRIDLARNAEMEHPCVAYTPVFSLLRVPRSKRQATYPDGYGTGNNRFGFNAYNKGKELRPEHKEYDQDNLMRQELQFKHKDVIAKKLHVVSVNDMYEAGMEQLNKCYQDTMRGEVYKAKDLQLNQVLIPFASHLETLIDLQKEHGRQAINVWLNLYGVAGLVEAVGSTDAVLAVIDEAGYHRNTRMKYGKRIQRLMNTRAMLKQQKGIGKLYREMLQKFVA